MVLSVQKHLTDSLAFESASNQFPSSGSRQSNQVKQKLQALWTALILLSFFFGVELSAGILSHSLSLLADAEHILSDVAALGLALLAIWLSRSMSKGTVFGGYRLEVLAALVNGIGLACIAGWIVKEALVRLQSPSPEILGLPMLATALLGLGVNSFNALYLHGCSRHDLNMRGVFLHFLADLVSSVGTVLAAIAVIWLNWTWADGVISLVVACLIALFAATQVTQSIHCLRGKVTNIANGDCLCDLQTENCSVSQWLTVGQRQQAEKLLFPSLQELI
ncbi:cation diffusion facilitator family transporter [Cylindrospermum stagnale PCC 7417]|uniref:Cation diffusion facilitator family transporter n=1 Tax=Cylindrospermum stagnale PCC 7417 TaxID=56107 RepID=K9WX47_9NOST|nr:cation diffusion facilitator family transporter [Cylindrospermum stagnale]AFZ24376.1 cation diffusion facilitator family transporter [Cylindrospermum stagnale PCC 7417]